MLLGKNLVFPFLVLSSNFNFDLLAEPWTLRSAVLPHIRSCFNYEAFEGCPLGSAPIDSVHVLQTPPHVLPLTVPNMHTRVLAFHDCSQRFSSPDVLAE